MSDINYAEIAPTQPSPELLELAEKQYSDTNALVFRVDYERNVISGERTKYVRCTCTACNSTFGQIYSPGGLCARSGAQYGFYNERTSEHVKSYDCTLCPICGAPVRAISISSMRDEATLADNPFAEVVQINGNLAIVCFWIQKSVNKQGCISITSQLAEAYIAEGKKMIKLVGYRRYFNSYIIFRYWERRKRCDDTFIGFRNVTVKPFSEKELIGTYCENSKLDIFAQRYPSQMVSYLRLWQKHKNIENLVTQGCANFVSGALHEATNRSYGYYYTKFKGSTNIQGLNLSRAKPHEILGLSKEDYKQVKKRKWVFDDLVNYKRHKAYDRSVTPENAKDVDNMVGFLFSKVEETGESLVKITNYLKKQREKHPATANNCDTRTLLDYWELCQKRNISLDETEVRYPQNLVAKHDQLVELIEFEANKELVAKYKARTKKLNAFCFEDEETGLMITPARSEKELISEGKNLHHCVATYAKRHAEGETAIFFIRHTDNPTEPFFTLELDEKQYKVRQNRGKRNCARTPEVEAFERKWLAWLKENNIGKEDKKNGKRNRKQPAAAVA